MVDRNEAIWGDYKKEKKDRCLWTNDETQIAILKRAFDNLWQEAQFCK